MLTCFLPCFAEVKEICHLSKSSSIFAWRSLMTCSRIWSWFRIRERSAIRTSFLISHVSHEESIYITSPLVPVHSIQSRVFSCSQRFFCLSHTSLLELVSWNSHDESTWISWLFAETCENCSSLSASAFSASLSFRSSSSLRLCIKGIKTDFRNEWCYQSIIHFFHGFASGLFEWVSTAWEWHVILVRV